MSATVKWRPLKGGKSCGKGPLRDVLEKAFGRWPLTLHGDDAEKLRMLAQVVSASNVSEELNDLADAVDKHEEIEVWAEY